MGSKSEGQVSTATVLNWRLEWSNVWEIAADVHPIRGGVRLVLPALHYNEIVDLVNREMQCCGSWLEMNLVRQDDVIILDTIASTDQGQSILRALVGLGEC